MSSASIVWLWKWERGGGPRQVKHINLLVKCIHNKQTNSKFRGTGFVWDHLATNETFYRRLKRVNFEFHVHLCGKPSISSQDFFKTGKPKPSRFNGKAWKIMVFRSILTLPNVRACSRWLCLYRKKIKSSCSRWIQCTTCNNNIPNLECSRNKNLMMNYRFLRQNSHKLFCCQLSWTTARVAWWPVEQFLGFYGFHFKSTMTDYLFSNFVKPCIFNRSANPTVLATLPSTWLMTIKLSEKRWRKPKRVKNSIISNLRRWFQAFLPHNKKETEIDFASHK